jgi:hypothetical protein
MPSRKLHCRCGHSWEYTGEGPLPADLQTICPVCTGANQRTQELAQLPEALPGADPSRPAQLLKGFEILEELNRGGMGVIYKARQRGLNRLVALKMISPEYLSRPESLHRFQREVRAAALLSHPNIVTVYHTELEGPLPYLAMEFVPGIDLWRLVKRGGRLPVPDACYYVRETAHGLQHAFEKGLVHRDIKPANLMVTPSPLEAPVTPSRPPQVKILDLGLARVTATTEVEEGAATLTRAGEFLGTPDYIAPEQAEDPRQADIRADLFSLGGTFYYLLTGEIPFPGSTLMQKLRRQLTGPRPSAAARRPDVPPALDALVQRLMAPSPADRFQSPAELIAALDGVLRGVPAAAAPPTAVRPTAPATLTSPAGDVLWAEAHAGGVQALCIGANGELLLSGGLDETLRLWDAAGLQEVRCLAGDVGPVAGLALAPGGAWAASCALRLFKSDMVVQLWDLASGRERGRLRGHERKIHCVAVAPDGRRVAAGGADHTVHVWTLDSPGAPALCLRGHADAVRSVVILPGGNSLLSGGYDGTVRQWDARTGAAKGSLPVQAGKIEALAFSGPGNRLAIAGGRLRLRQADSKLLTLPGHRGPVLCVAFSADGQWLLSGGSDGSVRLWWAADGREVCRLEGHRDRVQAVVFSPCGRVAFSGSRDGTIRRWPLGTG